MIVESTIIWDIPPCSVPACHLLSLLHLARFVLRSWKCLFRAPQRRRLICSGLHGDMSQKIVLFIATAARTSVPALHTSLIFTTVSELAKKSLSPITTSWPSILNWTEDIQIHARYFPHRYCCLFIHVIKRDELALSRISSASITFISLHITACYIPVLRVCIWTVISQCFPCLYSMITSVKLMIYLVTTFLELWSSCCNVWRIRMGSGGSPENLFTFEPHPSKVD